MARPREFDRRKALREAMETFWDHGYEHASTARLEQRMQIGRSSFYASFGSKDELYAEAMDLYIDDFRRRVLDRLQTEGPALEGLERFFQGVADRGRPGAERLRFCMVVRASLSTTDHPVRIKKRIAQFISELDDAFYGVLRRAREEGTLRAGTQLREAARYLTTTFQAMNVAAHAGRSRRELREIVARALDTLR